MADWREPDSWLVAFSKPGLVEQCAARQDVPRAREARRVEPDDPAAYEALQSVLEAQ